MKSSTSAKSSVASAVISWVLSLGSIIGGVALFISGRSVTVTAQTGANEGTITDATEYYTKITNGDTSVTLAAALIAAGIIGLIITLSQYNKPAVVVAGAAAAPLAWEGANEDFSSFDSEYTSEPDGATNTYAVDSDDDLEDGDIVITDAVVVEEVGDLDVANEEEPVAEKATADDLPYSEADEDREATPKN